MTNIHRTKEHVSIDRLGKKSLKKKRKIGSDYNFSPSTKILSRIMKIILQKNSIGRTTLSLKTNTNYASLSRHLDWMEEKRLVRLLVEDGKVNLKLTSQGREFATKFCQLLDVQNDQFD